jgi:receptor expression-enhancing protein 5/6
MPSEENLVVNVHKATGLKAADIGGKSDPYCVVYWEGDDPKGAAKTSVVQSTLDPAWNETLTVPWRDKSTLIIDIYDKDLTSSDFLGRVAVPVQLMTSTEANHPLKPRAGHRDDKDISGTITLSFTLPDSVAKNEAGVAGLMRSVTAGGAPILLDQQINMLDKRLAGYPAIGKLAKSLGVSPGKLAAGFLVFAFLFLVFGFGASAACNVAGVLYPTYASFKAVKSVEEKDDAQWLMYWIFFSFFSLAEAFADRLIFWMPFYYAAKFFFLLWAMHPVTQGASYVYHGILEPIFKRYENSIDAHLKRMGHDGKFAEPDDDAAASGARRRK